MLGKAIVKSLWHIFVSVPVHQLEVALGPTKLLVVQEDQVKKRSIVGQKAKMT